MNGLPALAQNLASQGRYGDSVLVHMSPEEVGGLRSLAQQQGMDMTINPQTGLPEAFKLKKLFRRLAPILPFVIPGVGTALAAMGAKAGLGALASKAIASGVIGGFAAPGKGFNFKEGLKTGIMAYAGGKLAEGLQSAGQAGQTGVSTGPGGTGGTAPSVSRAVTADQIMANNPNMFPGDAAQAAAGLNEATQAAQLSNIPAAAAAPIATPTVTPSLTETPTMAGVQEAGRGVSNIVSGVPGASAAFTQTVGVQPSTAALLGITGMSALEGMKEEERIKEQLAAQEREEARRRQIYADLFGRTLGAIPAAAGGGIVALAGGGMPTFEYGGTTAPTGEPRMVQGAGDGMSDNVPATIEGVQEARLANDEFVIPADVVADIGNGSSNAGAKKLYAMMDRIRKARHGTTEQPPEINAERLMPA